MNPLKNNYQSAFFYQHLQQARNLGPGFHMPGNAAGRAWSEEVARSFARLDLTETQATDNLNEPGLFLQKAQAQVAALWGAGHSFFVTSGSTTSLKAALLVGAGEGGRVLLPRPCHQAIYHGISLFHLQRHYLPLAPTSSSLLLSGEALLAEWEAIFAEEEAGALVVLTSPDYFGCRFPLPVIADACHRYGHRLLIDQAHGAALRFLDPEADALACGADFVVHSLHKSLPCLTPASLLHLGETYLQSKPDVLSHCQQALRLLQTSSPSFPIAASIDLCRAWLEEGEGQVALRKQQRGIEAFAQRLRQQGWQVSSQEPLRLVVETSPLAPGTVLAQALFEQGIEIEMADWRRLVLLFPFGLPAKRIDELERALLAFRQAGPRYPTGGFSSAEEVREADRLLYTYLSEAEEGSLPPPALSSWLCGEALIPYPPGLPLVLPGEKREIPVSLRRHLEIPTEL